MKPPEILSLLEEAAGTRLYEKKKEQSLKVLEKKQAKLDQIDQVGWGGARARRTLPTR
jgi:structural maintenance of chromosome 2